MRKLGMVLVVMALGACSFVSIADRYGNQYGDWYNPGTNFTWQLVGSGDGPETGDALLHARPRRAGEQHLRLQRLDRTSLSASCRAMIAGAIVRVGGS